MKDYECDYTWEDVKDATNRCMKLFDNGKLADMEDPVKQIHSNALPSGMVSVATHYFVDGLYPFDADDIKLIREAFVQLSEVGYIGKGK